MFSGRLERRRNQELRQSPGTGMAQAPAIYAGLAQSASDSSPHPRVRNQLQRFSRVQGVDAGDPLHFSFYNFPVSNLITRSLCLPPIRYVGKFRIHFTWRTGP